MSLETKIDELKDSVDKLTAALLAQGGKVTVVTNTDAGKGDEGGKSASKGKSGTAKDKGDDAGKDKGKGAAADAPSEEDIRSAFGEFMRVDDEDDREKRKDFVKKLLKKHGVAKATELKPEDRADAIAAVKAEGKRLAKAGDGDDDLV